MMATLAERFSQKYSPEPNTGCWLWTAAENHGYGVIKIDGRYHPAHRVGYELAGHSIPEGMVLDHLCRNTFCVNPAHLEPVSIGENIQRGANHYRGRTHCKHGHEFSPENTRVLPNGTRICRECARIRITTFKKRAAL